jgi:hypothetical protein
MAISGGRAARRGLQQRGFEQTHLAVMGYQALAGRRRHGRLAAHDQQFAGAVFQHAQALRNGGLGDRERGGSLVEVAIFDDGVERGQPAVIDLLISFPNIW